MTRLRTLLLTAALTLLPMVALAQFPGGTLVVGPPIYPYYGSGYTSWSPARHVYRYPYRRFRWVGAPTIYGTGVGYGAGPIFDARSFGYSTYGF